MKLSKQIREIISADADLVSLVDRPANRIPFRIMKSEDGDTATLTLEDKPMSIDLGRLGQLLTKKAPAVPTITTFIVAKSMSEADADQLVKDAGFSTSDKSVTDEAYIYKMADTPADTPVVQLTDDVAVTVTGLAKAFYDYDFRSTDFGMVSATNGFYPSLSMGMSALNTVVSNILEKSDNAGSAKNLVKQALSDFTGYAAMLVDALPETAFKAEMLAIAKAEATRSFRAPSGIAQAPMSGEADKPHEVRTESAEAQRVASDLGHRAQTNTDSRETGPAETQSPAANQTAAARQTGDAVADGTAHTAATAVNIDATRSANAPRDADVATLNEENAAENRGGTAPTDPIFDYEAGEEAKRTATEAQATGLQNSEPSKVEQMLATLMSQIAKAEETNTAKFAALETRLNKSDSILSGRVAAPAHAEVTPVKKSASTGVPPLLDTAINRNLD